MPVTAPRIRLSTIVLHGMFLAFCVIFIIPLWSLIAISLSSDSDIANFGYQLIPRTISFEAYVYIFKKPMVIINSYKVTMIISIIGTLLSVWVMSMCAYALSRKDFKYRTVITFYMFFTMLFSGGLVPYYILMTKYLHLQNTYASLILPLISNVWYLFLMRTFFTQIPESLAESAKIDGAGEARIYWTLIIPLSRPVIATIGLFQLLAYWNSWYQALLFISKGSMYPLQYLLQIMMQNIQEIIKNMQNNVPFNAAYLDSLPTENMRMAMCILAIGPMLVVFPFFQKYFAKGITVGAVKG